MSPDIFNRNLFQPTYSNNKEENTKKNLCLEQSDNADDFIIDEYETFLTGLRFHSEKKRFP